MFQPSIAVELLGDVGDVVEDVEVNVGGDAKRYTVFRRR